MRPTAKSVTADDKALALEMLLASLVKAMVTFAPSEYRETVELLNARLREARYETHDL